LIQLVLRRPEIALHGLADVTLGVPVVEGTACSARLRAPADIDELVDALKAASYTSDVGKIDHLRGT
jgi:hypothetical protein